MAREANPVAWFEIPATDLERAKAFYEHLLQAEMSIHELGELRMAWFPMVEEGAGATGALVQADSYVPSHEGAVVYFSVDDIEAVLARSEERGGRTLNPKMSIGEFGFVGHLEDSEGNRVALHSRA